MTALAVGLTIVTALAGTALAGPTPSDVPLFLRAGTTPNLVMTFDDSGSMAWGYVPDALGNSSTKRNSALFTAASYNAMYYNPKVRYDIPTRTDSVTYSTSFTNAYVNGFDTSRGAVNLSSTGYKPIYSCAPGTSSSSCLRTTGGGVTTSSTTRTYTYNSCEVKFDDRGGSKKDRIEVEDCSPSMPATGDGSPEDADEGLITVSNAGSYSRTYSVESSEKKGNKVRIQLATNNEISRDNDDYENVRFTWTTTETTTASAPAYYHLLYTDKPGASRPANCSTTAPREDPDCYILVLVGSGDDIFAGTIDEKKQNFANWFSFYRSRALATMSAAMSAVTLMSNNQVRLAWQTINSGCTTFGTSCDSNFENRIRPLDALKTGSNTVTHRTDFYNWIAKFNVNGGTPLRAALERAGDYFKLSGKNSPYAEDPYVTQGTELSCRRNFHLMLTDGIWNGTGSFTTNTDTSNKTLPDGTSYTARAPYKSASSANSADYANTLADLAFDYWSTDLRTNLANNLPAFMPDRSGTSTQQYWNARNNPATWQHMTNYFIAFGLGSLLDDPAWGGSTYAGDYPALASGAVGWPAISTDAEDQTDVGKVYDLWHAAINSRGEFYSADNADQVINAFKNVLNSVLSTNASAAALAANSTSVQTNSLIFQAKFDSGDWHGQLRALDISSSGVVSNVQWDASERMPAASARNITVWTGSSAANFTNCANLSASQKALLDKTPAGETDNQCADRLAWLRGDATKELRNGGPFRNRLITTLGDIVNSDPVYAQAEDFGYKDSGLSASEKTTYAAYVTSKQARTPVVFAGANDGMLHAFRADKGAPDSGKELFAHIPAGVFENLNRLPDPAYSHRFYVDGGPVVGDAYWAGQWRTVLVGGLGAGGKSIYAIDISNPTAHSAAKVLWEFTDADLGLTYSQPKIARLNNGDWAAIFGNGYNSTSDKAFLFVVNLQTGALLKKIATNASTGNGLSSVEVLDTDSNRIVDFVYAGDLKGNLWKFDLSSSSAASWGLGNGGVPLFTATTASGGAQPITTKPAVAAGTGQPATGHMVLFGTGQYLTSSDPANTGMQSFYGIWDDGNAGTRVRSKLRQQTITAETSVNGQDLRETSSNAIDWSTQQGWYMDLASPSAPSTGGERVVTNPLAIYDRAVFVTMKPVGDSCNAGGISWVMEVDYGTGSVSSVSVFDLNGDGQFTDADKLPSGNFASGIKSAAGISKTPLWIEQSSSSPVAIKQITGSTGDIFSLTNRKPATLGGVVRRTYWQQIQ